MKRKANTVVISKLSGPLDITKRHYRTCFFFKNNIYIYSHLDALLEAADDICNIIRI
jgi:hypothetical protein